MAEIGEIVEIRNETALDISISNKRTLKPLEVAEYEPGAVAILSFIVPRMGGRFMYLVKSKLPPAVTIDLATVVRNQQFQVTAQQFCDKLPSLGEQSSNELRVTNETGHVACVWLLDQTGGRMMGAIGPGETWHHPTEPFLMWHFRIPSGLTLGMWVHPNPHLEPDEKPPFQVKLTTDFLDAWHTYQQRPAQTKGKRGLAPLRLIGDRRASTPSPDDQLFISASTVRLDLSKEPFNGLENRVVRDVEIAGPLLRWSGSNRILSGYYGASNAADIRSLTIYCDRMEVADHLEFPRTNVTIHARELVFTGNGRIDTTPLPYPGRAESKYLTEHPDDATMDKVPADADGKPTYKAADGRMGEPGGSITVYAREMRYVEDPGNKAPWLRFFCRGGKGQQGEAGGLKAYERGEGQPEKYGPLPPVTADQVARNFKEAFKLDCWHFSWPGQVDGPSQIPDDPWKKRNVVEVSVFAYSGGWWLRYLRLPSNIRHDGLPNLDHDLSKRFKELIAAPRRCNPRDAYPGGWPGDGGDGGSFALVTEKLETANYIASIRESGAVGDPTLPVKGDQADADLPVHLWLQIWDKEIAGGQVPAMGTEPNSGSLHGRDADGRAGRPPVHELSHDKYLAWTDDSIVDKQSRVFETRPYSRRLGLQERVERSDLSWAQPAAMAAVLSHARTAFRNGFRDEAAQALGPYYAMTLAQTDKIAQCGTEVRLAFASMATLYGNLGLNVDYYGNPPGWVPRLNALSNLAVLKGVREAAYGTYYFADRMLRDAEALEDLRETAVQTTDALAAEMSAAKQKLQKAYEQLPAAMGKLNEAQKRVTGVEEEIVALRKEAIARSVDKAMVQRFVSAALQMVDGVAKALPVGQPFLGLAGSVFGAAAKIDWTAEKPLETGGAAITHLSEQVNTFVTTKGEAVANAVTGQRRGKATATEDLVTRLTREQEDSAKVPAEAVKAAEVTWQECKSTEFLRVEEQIKKTQATIAAWKDTGKDDEEDHQAGSAFLDALNKQKEVLARKRVGSLQKELVDYRKQQFELINRAQRVAKGKNEALKAQAVKTPATDLPPSVADKLAAATRQSEDQKALIARKEATATETMTKLEGLGTGLASVGNAIISMATPITDDDPTVQRLADEMLVQDPVLRAAGERFTRKLLGLLDEKRQAAAELLLWQQQATTSLATVTRNLATMTELSKQRQSIDMGLNPAAKAYLKETRDAAKDALAESVYWFVKSYQYEFLKDVDDSFFNFDTWASELHKQEKAKLGLAAPAVDPPTGQGPVVTRAPKILLSKEDFEAIGDAVFKAEQLKLGAELLKERQTRGPTAVGEYLDCVLQRTDQPQPGWQTRQNEMLDALGNGEVAFDFVRDFAKGSYDWNHARVAQVKLVWLDIEASDPNLSLTFRVQQHGDAVIAKKVGNERQLYLFRAGRDDDPVGWTFVYNHQQRRTNSGITTPTVADPLGDVAKELINDKLTFQEYQPALFSDYLIRITDLFGANGEKKGLKRIKGLTMTVFLSGG